MENELIYLLVRADDIGCAQAANAACMDVFTKGIARSVEIMAPCAWFPEAAKLLQAHPTYDVGVHLTLTSEWENVKWRPLSNVSSIVDHNGYFCHTFWQGSRYPDLVPFCDLPWTPADLESEVRAQIELVRKHIPWASHLTVHMMGLRDDVYLHSGVPGRKKKKELRKTVREILKDLEVKVRGIRTESEQLAVIAEIGLAVL